MSGGGSIGSQKEMTAVINNLKESRVLDKAIDTLTLEESYSVKLIDLNTKMINLKYNRLQANVSKIKTNLTSSDIAAMRALEMEGKFKPENPMIVASPSHSKIAAAAKRLRIGNGYYRQTRSAMPQMAGRQVRPITEPAMPAASLCSTPRKLGNRRHSASTVGSETPSIKCKKTRPHTSVVDAVLRRQESVLNEKPKRPSTAQILEKIATAQKARKNLNNQALYNCHDCKGSHGNGVAADVFGPNPYEVRRRRYLDEEHETFSKLATRQDNFLMQTAKFVSENPCVHDIRPDATREVIDSIDSTRRSRGSGKTKLWRGLSKTIIQVARVDSALLTQLGDFTKLKSLDINDVPIDLCSVKQACPPKQAKPTSSEVPKTRVCFDVSNSC